MGGEGEAGRLERQLAVVLNPSLPGSPLPCTAQVMVPG